MYMYICMYSFTLFYRKIVEWVKELNSRPDGDQGFESIQSQLVVPLSKVLHLKSIFFLI